MSEVLRRSVSLCDIVGTLLGTIRSKLIDVDVSVCLRKMGTHGASKKRLAKQGSDGIQSLHVFYWNALKQKPRKYDPMHVTFF